MNDRSARRPVVGIAHGTGGPRAAYHDIVITDPDPDPERRTGTPPRVNGGWLRDRIMP